MSQFTQVASPNLTVIGRSGYCLEMQDNVWSAEHWYKYAEQSWNNSTGYTHPGELPPDDVSVLVYWTYYDVKDSAEYGHIATWVPGRGVYSSTFNTAIGAEWYPSIQAMTDRINKIPGAKSRYLGWSEVISNVTAVREGDTMFEGRSAEDWATQAKDAEQYKQGVIKSLAWKVIPGQPGGGMHEDPAYIRTEIDSLVQFKADTLAAQSAEYLPYSGPQLFTKK